MVQKCARSNISLTDGKRDGWPGAIVHVPAAADVEVLVEAESARAKTRRCYPLVVLDDARDRRRAGVVTRLRGVDGRSR